MINYYKVLGVDKSASQEDIKRAYVKLLKNYHPDLYKGDEKFAQEKTALINESYQTLKDTTLRKQYDDIMFGQESVVPKENFMDVFKEFTKRFKVNTNNKSQKTSVAKKTKNNKKVKENVKKIEQPVIQTDLEKLEKKERTKLTITIISIMVVISVIILLCLI